MSSKIQFIPLSGSKSEGPVCNLLIIDDFHILLDCGWDERFTLETKYIQELKKLVDYVKPITYNKLSIAPKIDIVLLSHSDIQHVGALPYAVGKLGLKAKVFCTLPTAKMSQMFMYDAYQNHLNQEDFDLFNLDDVDNVFDEAHLLKYSQRYQITSEKGEGIIIVPFVSGHSLGGAIWKIQKEADEIVYAVDYNIKKERHLNGADFERLGKPSILITDCYSALRGEERNADQQIIQKVTKTLYEGGNVLIPSDAAARVLEILLLFERHWKKEKTMQNFGLFFLSTFAYSTVHFASHQLEWMSDSVMKGFDERRENPFKFKHVEPIASMEQLNKSPKKPYVVIATSSSLDYGFSKELLATLAPNPKNLILLMDRSFPNSTTRLLIEKKVQKLDLLMVRRIPITGKELEEHLKMMQSKKEAEDKRKREEEAHKKVIEIRDEELTTETKTVSEAPSHLRLFLPENMRYHSQYLMFPCIENTYTYDEYGQTVNIEELQKLSEKIYEEQEDDDEFPKPIDDMDIDQMEQHETPTRLIRETISVDILCEIAFIDYEGRVDGRSIKKILSRINPRKLVIIHGPSNAAETLKKYCENKQISEKIFTPDNLEMIDITMDTKMFHVLLKEDLLNQIERHKVGVYDIGFVEGEYRYEEEGKLPAICPIIGTEGRGHPTLFIGDLKLRQFKEVLDEAGFNTRFQKGKLICNNIIALARNDSGEIVLEGSLSKDYFKVRKLLYSQYKIL